MELKAGKNADIALKSAMQLIQYGAVYLFSRKYSGPLGYRSDLKPVLSANQVHLRVLAPWDYFHAGNMDIAQLLTTPLSSGIDALAQAKLNINVDFAFERLPEDFRWDPTRQDDVGVRKDLLWAIHNRQQLPG